MTLQEQTLSFYDDNSATLIERYDAADMSALHQLLDAQIPSTARVMDIGFGSGRDLYYLLHQGHDVWGVDGSERFVKSAQERFPNIKERFLQSALPTIKIPLYAIGSFDVVLCIAVWMHLLKTDYEASVKSITALCKAQSRVIISFSKGERDSDDKRYFEEVDSDLLIGLFKDEGFDLKIQTSNDDGLERHSLTWDTLVFSRD